MDKRLREVDRKILQARVSMDKLNYTKKKLGEVSAEFMDVTPVVQPVEEIARKEIKD